MPSLEIQYIPILSDNYAYLAHDPGTGATAAVDPAVAGPVCAALDRLGWKLTHILNTHHHDDHVGGNMELKRATGCKIVGSRAEASSTPGVDMEVGEGDEVAIGGQTARVFLVPGHTRGHVAYWFEDSRALFSGDALFSLGCGRLFEGTAEQMWSSLNKLRALPDETNVYCAHEYTSANADFALTIEPGNAALKARAENVQALRWAGKPTVPSTMAEEKTANPFLRADQPELIKAAGLAGKDAVSVFAEIRRRKDSF